MSPWVVSPDALAPFACAAPPQSPPPLPYLVQHKAPRLNYDIQLEVAIQARVALVACASLPPSPARLLARWAPLPLVALSPARTSSPARLPAPRTTQPEGREPSVVTRTNYRTLYWTTEQMVAHHTAGERLAGFALLSRLPPLSPPRHHQSPPLPPSHPSPRPPQAAATCGLGTCWPPARSALMGPRVKAACWSSRSTAAYRWRWGAAGARRAGICSMETRSSCQRTARGRGTAWGLASAAARCSPRARRRRDEARTHARTHARSPGRWLV